MSWRDFAAGASVNILSGGRGVEVIRLVELRTNAKPLRTGAAAVTVELSQGHRVQLSNELPAEA